MCLALQGPGLPDDVLKSAATAALQTALRSPSYTPNPDTTREAGSSDGSYSRDATQPPHSPATVVSSAVVRWDSSREAIKGACCGLAGSAAAGLVEQQAAAQLAAIAAAPLQDALLFAGEIHWGFVDNVGLLSSAGALVRHLGSSLTIAARRSRRSKSLLTWA